MFWFYLLSLGFHFVFHVLFLHPDFTFQLSFIILSTDIQYMDIKPYENDYIVWTLM